VELEKNDEAEEKKQIGQKLTLCLNQMSVWGEQEGLN